MLGLPEVIWAYVNRHTVQKSRIPAPAALCSILPQGFDLYRILQLLHTLIRVEGFA